MLQMRWIFAYGSLMWNPGVPVAEAVHACLDGWQRSFCLRSTIYRGNPQQPGLVLGLDPAPGHACEGLALGIAGPDWPDAIAVIRARELVTYAYAEIAVPLRLADGRQVEALTYVVRPEHEQYAGGLAQEDQAAMIACATGKAGPNSEYLEMFLLHLHQMGLRDEAAEGLAARVRALRAV